MYITSVEILAFFYAQIQKNPKKPYPQIFIREKSFHNYFENEKDVYKRQDYDRMMADFKKILIMLKYNFYKEKYL